MQTELLAQRTTDRVCIEQGLWAYMVKVYSYMAGGLALTGAVAYGVSTSAIALQVIFNTPFFWVVVLAPFGVLLYICDSVETRAQGTVQTMFWLYAGLMGLSLAVIFIEYTGISIARLFFITASTFGAMSIYGYTTRKDLSGSGSFLFMGLIGIIIASFVNIFLDSSALDFVVSGIGVIVFVGFTAHDTQAIKALYLESDVEEARNKKAIFGALVLYLDFLNLFLRLLELFGDSEQ